MTRQKLYWLFLPVLLAFGTAGCGSFMAHRMAQAPNTYPQWLAAKAPVTLVFNSNFSTNFPRQSVTVGPPAAQLCYRIVEPADYHLKIASTNWLEHGQKRYEFRFHADLPGRSNVWTSGPRGTVVLLHGYALAQFTMMPWALLLAQEGWRCVLVDLRGHGKSTGNRIFYGVQEARDLGQLLDQLGQDGRLQAPVAAFGDSYGASLALRWESTDPRVCTAVAITPYAGLSNVVLNLCHEYADWLPRTFLRAGLRKLPSLLEVPTSELDTTTPLIRHPVPALFVSGAEDKIAQTADVKQLYSLAAPGSELIVVPGATHEAVLYYFDDLAPPVLAWLSRTAGPETAATSIPPAAGSAPSR